MTCMKDDVPRQGRDIVAPRALVQVRAGIRLIKLRIELENLHQEGRHKD